MKTLLVFSVIAAAALSANSIDEAFVAGKMDNQLRMAYISQDNEVDTDTYGTSIGGILKYETAEWNGVKLGVGAYISQKLHFASGDVDEGKVNTDLFDKEGKSYAYVGEAYVDYTMDTLNLKVGRQLIDTPFADTDDIRMHPNTFEAAIATYTGLEGTTLVGGYVTRWAGYDSEDADNGLSKDKFKKLGGEGSDGVVVLGAINESIENLAVQGWYYDIDELSRALYADATYAIPFSETMGLELSAQYAHFSEEKASGMDGSVYGVGAVFNVSALTLGAAYNKASNDEGKYVSNGFGGGPYMTSMEEMTIDGFEDVKAYQLNGQLDMSIVGAEGLSFTALYGDFKSTPADMHVKEIDLIAVYEIKEGLVAEVSYAMVDDKKKNTAVDEFDVAYDGGYERFLVRLNYNF